MYNEIAPAKLTLTLRLLDRREDGFNNLEALTVFLPEISDTLNAAEQSNEKAFNVDDENLIVRAWKLFFSQSSVSNDENTERLMFRLTKVIPIAAGLGGGSADAAAMLRMLNQLSKHLFSTSELATIGAQLGSDIPACVYSQGLWMRGRGEEIETLDGLHPFDDLRVLVVTPDISCSTPAVYARYEELGRPHDEGIESPAELHRLTTTLHNDLASAAYDLFPELESFKSTLEPLVQIPIQLAGSGSTFFAVSTSEKIERALIAVRSHEALGNLRLCATSALQ